MPIAALVSLCLTLGMFFFSLVFKVAGKLRLTLPVICFLLFVTVLNRWAGEHETLAFIILFALLGLTVLSWILSLVKAIRHRRENKRLEDDAAWQIRKAREMGIPLDNIKFNEQGDLLDPSTGEPVVYGDNVPFRDS